MSHIVELVRGDQVLTHLGLASVVDIGRHGVSVMGPSGATDLPFAELEVRHVTQNGAQAVHQPLTGWWFSLSDAVRENTLTKLEVVLEILTGYRRGWPSEAFPGEPFGTFGPGSGLSLHQQSIHMARHLTFERGADRAMVRRVADGELVGTSVSARSIRLWVSAYRKEGLRGLVDGRHTRTRKDFDDLDPRFRAIVEEVIAPFDGTVSAINVQELRRRVWLGMKEQGLARDVVPERLSLEFISWRYAACGSRPRAHRSAKVRKRSAHQPSPVVHPAHVSMDSTRADNLVWDELRQTSYSVEITAIISVSTRVILALRVTPRSANGVEAGLCLYDAMRPFSMQVKGTEVDDWRWAGVPRSLESPLFLPRQPVTHADAALQGTHHIPGLRPSSIRTDHGSIFMSAHFKGLLRDFGISLWPSRVGASTDNAHIERFWETIQRALQQVPGYKGRSVSQRGRKVITADRPVMTARELETYLHRFVALDYHRAPHDGLKVPGLESQRVTPLEYFDFVMEACGDISVPQHPDLIYDFLPIRWLTVGHAGVEYKGLSYDSDVLDAYRHVRRGTYRAEDSAAPFIYDPRDCTRLWFRDPADDRVREIPSRHTHLLIAPLTERIREKAITQIAARGGNKGLRRDTPTQQIIDELGQLYAAPPIKDWNAMMTAERLRFETAQRDHAEVTEAWKRVTQRTPAPTVLPEHRVSDWLDETWPDLAGP